MLKDYAEFGLAAAAFLLASVVFRNQNPKKASSRESGVLAVTASFLFSEWHAFVLSIYPGLEDQYYESEQAFNEMDHESDVYPTPTEHRPVRCSMETDHFTYAGSSFSDDDEDANELDHMYPHPRENSVSQQMHLRQHSTAPDHFSYAGSCVDDVDETSEYDHFDYGGERRVEAAKKPNEVRSTASDHFSFAGSAVDDNTDVNECLHDELDHFDYSAGRKFQKRVDKIDVNACRRCFHSTAADHFTYAGSSFAEAPERSEYDHFDYGDVSPPRQTVRYQGSVARDHFSYAGSFEEEFADNEYDHFDYAGAATRSAVMAC